MYNVKEKADKIRPLHGFVKTKILIPRELVSRQGIVLNQIGLDKYFKEITMVHCKVQELGPDAQKALGHKIKKHDIIVVDLLAGTIIPTEGNDAIKLVPYPSIVAKCIDPEKVGSEIDPLNLEPLGERLLARIDSLRTQTDAGIIMTSARSADRINSESIGGTVLAISDEIKKTVGYEVNDTIRWEGYAGIEFRNPRPGKETLEYRMLVCHDVIAKIDK